MKLLYFGLIAFLTIQQIAIVLAIDDELIKQFYESPHWKQSLAFDAPIVSAEETINHLKALWPLLEDNKDNSIDINDLYEEVTLKSLQDVDWDKNKKLGMMKDDLIDLIFFKRLVDKNDCYRDNFDYLYVIEDENYFGNPEQKLPYGQNIEAYLDYYRVKVLDLCRDEMKTKLNNDKSLKVLDDLVQKVSENGININNFNEMKENGSLMKAISSFLDTDDGSKRKSSKDKYLSVTTVCGHGFNDRQPNGFYNIALNKQPLISYIEQDEYLNEWALKFKLCKSFDRDFTFRDFDESNLNKIKNLFHKH